MEARQSATAALGAAVPRFAHGALLVGTEGKLSKRLGSLGADAIREPGIEPEALVALLARMGTSQPVEPIVDRGVLIESFDLAHFGRAPARFDEAELAPFNAALVHQLTYLPHWSGSRAKYVRRSMKRKLSGSPALLMLAACLPAGQETADAPSSDVLTQSGTPRASPIAPTGPPAITSPTELIGEYRIAGLGGASIDLPYGITASIDQRTIHVVADCVNLAWTYEFAADQLSTQRAPIESCARGLNPIEEGIVTAFDSADLVRLMPSNGIEFSGGGHSVLLFSQ